MSKLQLKTAEVFEPLIAPARYKGAWGGRGSGKSTFFAEKLIEDSMAEPGDFGVGLRSVCIREVQKDLAQSSKALIESIMVKYGIGEADGFKVYREQISTPGDGLIIFKGMNDYTADSIKSLEGFKRGWWEEAQTATARSLSIYTPTFRIDGAERWFSWNPRRKKDAIDVLLRGPQVPTGSVIVKANWRDNPWFTAELEQERQDFLRIKPEQYPHVWEGEYVSALEGAYYAAAINKARLDKRIGFVAADPLMSTHAAFDIGGTGARADAVAVWVFQVIGKQIRMLNYYEAVSQPLATHLNWLRDNEYLPKRTQIWLPHDGEQGEKVFDTSYESAIKSVGYDVTVVPNQGKGAAKKRIEVARRVFPSVFFNEQTTEPGIAALGWYHEKQDDKRDIGLGPEHDWSSHGCFHGATKVVTRYGMCMIMDLPKTGEVLTPCGWKQYINPRITKQDAQLVEVRFLGGYSVKCTPDHLFLTASGWKSAESLTQNTEIQSTLTKSRSILMAGYIVCGLAKDIWRAAARGFTGMLGRLLSGQYLKAATYTTLMGTPLITGWKISNAFRRKSTYLNRGTRELSQRPDGFQLRREAVPQTGINQLKVGSGILVMPRKLKAGLNGSALRKLVSIVDRSLWRLSEKAALMLESIALKPVKPLVIERVVKLSETADVWDITVPGPHCFSLQNGAVVHNSDAFGLGCIAAEQIMNAITPDASSFYAAFRR